MNMVDRVSIAICKTEFGSKDTYGEARCCKTGGTEGCCAFDMKDAAEAAIEAMIYSGYDAETNDYK